MLRQVTRGGSTYTYQYDALGNRVARIENGIEKRYIGGLVETDSIESIPAYYIYGLGVISKITPSNESYHYHFNGIGNTIAITNSLGDVVNKYVYDEFGKVLSEEETITNPFKYVGQFGVMDEENGLLYMRARYYDPEIGRFISKDPIGFAGGDLNLYAYVGNNPVNRIDPLGLKWYKSTTVLLDIAALALDVGGLLIPPLFIAGAGVSVVNTIFVYEQWRQGTAQWYDFAVAASLTLIGFIPHPVIIIGSDVALLIYDIYRAESISKSCK